MKVKQWLKEKIRSASGSPNLEYQIACLNLEAEKLKGIINQKARAGEEKINTLDISLENLAKQVSHMQEALTQLELIIKAQNFDEKLRKMRQQVDTNIEQRTEAILARFQETETQLQETETQLQEAEMQLKERLDQLQLCVERDQADLQKEIQRLNSIVCSGHMVKLVEYRKMQLFMLANDLITDKTTEEYRNIAGEYGQYTGIINGCNAISVLFHHYWDNNLDFTFLDVGCQYGHESILAGQCIQENQKKNKIHCFDAGQSSFLVPFNIKLNGLDEIIQFHQIAVGSSLKPSVMYYEPGYSEHNRLKNPLQAAKDSTTFSFPVQCTTLDRFCSDHGINNYIIAKLDTEGSEPDVIEGMRTLFAEHPLTFITEYSPYNFSQDHEADFLNTLLETHVLIDIGALQGSEAGCKRQGFIIADSNLCQYIAYLKSQVGGWADILAIPKALPNKEKILQLASIGTPF